MFVDMVKIMMENDDEAEDQQYFDHHEEDDIHDHHDQNKSHQKLIMTMEKMNINTPRKRQMLKKVNYQDLNYISRGD